MRTRKTYFQKNISCDEYDLKGKKNKNKNVGIVSRYFLRILNDEILLIYYKINTL